MSLPFWLHEVAGELLTDHRPGLGRCTHGLVAFRFEPIAAAGLKHETHTFRAAVAMEQSRWLISVCHLAAAKIGVREELGSCVAVNDDDQFVISVRGLPQLSANDIDAFVEHVWSWHNSPDEAGHSFDLPEPTQELLAVCV